MPFASYRSIAEVARTYQIHCERRSFLLPVESEPLGESFTLIVRAALTLARFIALKGSIAVDGVSLTINTVDDRERGCDFSINLIPHTVAVTTLKDLKIGDRVNLEIDTIARYVERVMGTTTSKIVAATASV